MIKDFIQMYRSKFNDYYNIKDGDFSASLRFLIKFFSQDYHPEDKNIFVREVTFYNITHIYNDLKNRFLYVGFSTWSLSDGEEQAPHDEDFPAYVNDTNTCKINTDNFIEFAASWVAMKQALPHFALMYKDQKDWIRLKTFDTQEAMEQFVANHTKQETIQS